MQGIENPLDTGSTEALTERQRPLRIAQRQLNGAIQGGGRGDAPLGDLATQVDDPGQHPLGDESRRVIDHLDRHAIGSKRLASLGQHIRVKGRLAHQYPAHVEPREGFQSQGALRRQLLGGDSAAGVFAQRCHQADRRRPRVCALLQLGASCRQYRCNVLTNIRVAAVQPERPVDQYLR
ncbi:hypothetical protein D3C76_1196960 [compost metagenome]